MLSGPGPRFPPEARCRPPTATRAADQPNGAAAGARAQQRPLPRATDAAVRGMFISRKGSGIEAEHDLGGAGGLLLALDLHVREDEALDCVPDLGRIPQAGVHAVPPPLLSRSGGAGPVGAGS